MSGGNWQWPVSFLLGSAFVALCAGARFKGPFADRSYTTFYRYWIATAYYVAGYFGAYCLIAGFVSWALHDFASARDSLLGHILQIPAWIALFTAVVLPRLPLLASLDRAFLMHVRLIGGIPLEARRLRDAIRAAKCQLPPEVSKEIHFSVLRRGLDLGNLRSVPDHTVHALFMRASELKYLLQRCEREQRFARFFLDNNRPLHHLVRRFDHLVFKSSRAVDAIGGLHDLVDVTSGKSDNWESLGSLVESEVYAGKSHVLDPAMSTSRLLINNLRDDMRFFIDDAAMILARLALYHARSEHGRVGLLRQIGVCVEPAGQPLYRSLVAAYVVVLVALFFGATIFGSATPGTVRGTILLLVMVPITFIVALFCAIYPKQYFAFANVNIFGRPPYAFFAAAGVAGAALAFVIGLAFRTLAEQSWEDALRKAYESSPWLLMSFTLALVTAILVQDEREPADARYRSQRRWWDAGILALALGAVSAIVQLLLTHTQAASGAGLRPWVIVVSSVIGGSIGFLVPYRFRTTFDAGRAALRPAAADAAEEHYSSAS